MLRPAEPIGAMAGPPRLDVFYDDAEIVCPLQGGRVKRRRIAEAVGRVHANDAVVPCRVGPVRVAAVVGRRGEDGLAAVDGFLDFFVDLVEALRKAE